MDNLQVACGVCNLIKRDILPEDLMKILREIILYQMKKSYDDNLWKNLNYVRRLKQGKNFLKMMKQVYSTLRWKRSIKIKKSHLKNKQL